MPVLDSDGRATVSAWVVHYKHTVVSEYKELVLIFHVVPPEHQAKPPQVPAKNPLKHLQLFDDKLAYPYIYKLWLDKRLPTSYGRELLGCDKYLDTDMKVDFSGR